MNIPDIIIAIDGYSSTGKSSFAKVIAKEFSFLYLDSGALYRGVTLFAIENGLIDDACTIDVPELEKALETLDVHFGEGGTYIADRCVEQDIRSLAVADKVSPIATVAQVRNYVDRKLREFGSRKRVVMDGRDIGTVILPDAQLKIFLTATPEERAMRRTAELIEKGQSADFEQILADIKERDERDSSRAIAPLKPADDAILFNNTGYTPEQSLEELLSIAKDKLGVSEVC